jgi:hypothetical protein
MNKPWILAFVFLGSMAALFFFLPFTPRSPKALPIAAEKNFPAVVTGVMTSTEKGASLEFAPRKRSPETNPPTGFRWQEQWAHAMAMPEGPAKKLRLDQTFAQWGRQDGPTALAWAMTEFEKSGNVAMVRSALQGMAEVNPGGALDAMKGANLSDRIKIDLGSQLLGHWAAKDAVAASGWALENRHPDWWGGPVALVAEVWARSDPQAAVQWSTQLSPGLDQMSALVAATSRWSKTDLNGVANYVTRQNPGLSRDIMSGTLAREFGQEDPISGLRWAALVQDPTGRQRAAAGAVADVYGKDPAQVSAILQGSGLSVTDQQAVLDRLQSGAWWK